MKRKQLSTTLSSKLRGINIYTLKLLQNIAKRRKGQEVFIFSIDNVKNALEFINLRLITTKSFFLSLIFPLFCPGSAMGKSLGWIFLQLSGC